MRVAPHGHPLPLEAVPLATRQKPLERDPGKPPDAAALTGLRPIKGADAQGPRARLRMVTPEPPGLAVPAPLGAAAGNGNGRGLALPKGEAPKSPEASTVEPIAGGSPGVLPEWQKRTLPAVPHGGVAPSCMR